MARSKSHNTLDCNYPTYVDNIMSKEPQTIANELDRLMTKIMRLQSYYHSKGGWPEEINEILF